MEIEKKTGQGKKWTRREFLKNLGLAITSLCLGGFKLFSPKKVSAQVIVPKEINIGVFGPSHCAVPFVYAKLKDFFKQENLSVNLINYPAMPLIAKDLIAGKLDFGQLIAGLPLAMHTGAAPFETSTRMAILAVTGVNGAALMVRKGSGITKPKDFKGKTIANHSKLAQHHILNRVFLEKHNIDFEKEMTFKVVELERAVDAMKNAEIDSFVMPEPKDALVEHLGLADVFMLSKYIWPNHFCCVLTTRREYFNQNTDLAKAVTRQVTRAGLEANVAETREQTIDLLQSSGEYNYDKVPKPVLSKAFVPGRSDFYPFPYQSTIRLLIELMVKFKVLPSGLAAKQLTEELVLADLNRKIIRELGYTPPKSNYREEKILGVTHKFT